MPETSGEVSSNGIKIAFDTFGDPTAAPLILIMGYGASMDWWDEGFCRLLAGRGFHVVRFDNRDVGRTTRFTAAVPDLDAVRGGDLSTLPYTLDDLADDVIGLCDALGFERAHLVGASMGGMIAQLATIRHPDRVLSLCSIMSAAGPLPPVTDPLLVAVTRGEPVPDDGREAAVAQELEIRRLIAGSGYPFDEPRMRDRAERAWDHDPHHDRTGLLRQAAAMAVATDRRPALAEVRVPVLVLHGTDDPLIPLSCGEQTAAAVPHAALTPLPGVGHELPVQVWPQVVDAIAANADRAATA